MASDCQQILTEINRRISELGDLPIFSATVNRIRKVSADPDSNAMELATEITKDANLTTRLLRMSNSTHYNRSNGKISVISRGIVLLGFNTIMNQALTLKLIESFQMDHPSVDMDRLLVKAYLTAGFARYLAIKAGVRDVEECYTCALIHNLGEIITAYALPERYVALQQDRHDSGEDSQERERRHLGATMADIGMCLAETWEFPSNILKTMEHVPPERIAYSRNPARMNAMLSTLASKSVEALQTGESSYGDLSFRELLDKLSDVLGVDYQDVENSVAGSFKMSCDLAVECGLKPKRLMPNIDGSNDEVRDRLARKLAYMAGHTAIKPEDFEPATEAPPDTDSDDADTGGADPSGINMSLQLQLIQEVTALISQRQNLQQVFAKVLEGITAGAGFDRAALMLVSPDLSHYAVRMAHGEDTDRLKNYFDHPLSVEDDFFSKILVSGAEMLVENTQDPSWAKHLPADLRSRTGANSFIIASLRNGDRPIGLFYADRNSSDAGITPEHYRGFLQFVAQARLALQMNQN